jgi:hypothetical protein
MGLGINDGAYLILKSPTRTYLIYQRRNITEFFKKGIEMQIPPQYLMPDTYQIGIFSVDGNERKIFNANQSVEVNY